MQTAIGHNNVALQEGDRVYCYDTVINGQIIRFYGTLKRNIEYPHVSDWYVEYDDGEKFAVLDMSVLFKA